MRTEDEGLRRGLKNRHIQLIAIGGAIGVGLFLGSGQAIAHTGPGVLLAYGFAGLMIFFVARALGELLLYKPVAGSFTAYAEEFIGPWAGFSTGWSYWFLLVVVSIAEITAIGIYVQFWFPDVPQWLPGFVILAAMLAINLTAVRAFGEFEFWFALIKVVTVLALIGFGIAILVFGFTDLGATASIGNLWRNDGFLPYGVEGVLLAFPLAAFSFGGIELIGMTAGEAENPSVTLPRAVNQVIRRILIFYIGALGVILCLVPWNRLGTGASPFVLVFDRVGVPAAAGVVNFVVITAAASSFNSGLYSAGRMLFTLGRHGQAPKIFGAVSSSHVPAAALIFSAVLMLFGVLLNYLVPAKAFNAVVSVDLVVQLWTWGMIVTAHLFYRRAVKEGRVEAVGFRMPGAPCTNYLVIAFLVVVAGLLAYEKSTRLALYAGPVWFALVTAGYLVLKKKGHRGVQDNDEQDRHRPGSDHDHPKRSDNLHLGLRRDRNPG